MSAGHITFFIGQCPMSYGYFDPCKGGGLLQAPPYRSPLTDMIRPEKQGKASRSKKQSSVEPQLKVNLECY